MQVCWGASPLDVCAAGSTVVLKGPQVHPRLGGSAPPAKDSRRTEVQWLSALCCINLYMYVHIMVVDVSTYVRVCLEYGYMLLFPIVARVCIVKCEVNSVHLHGCVLCSAAAGPSSPSWYSIAVSYSYCILLVSCIHLSLPFPAQIVAFLYYSCLPVSPPSPMHIAMCRTPLQRSL